MMIPRLITTKQLHGCFDAVQRLYDGDTPVANKRAALHLDENLFVDLMVLSAITAFGWSPGCKAELPLTLDHYSDTAREMWMSIFLVC